MRATYRCARNPDIWAISILLMMQYGDRFIADEAYRNGVIARLYREFWHFEADPGVNGTALSIAESDNALYLPADLVDFLMQIPVKAKPLRHAPHLMHTEEDADVECAQKMLVQLRDPQMAHLPDAFAQISPMAIR